MGQTMHHPFGSRTHRETSDPTFGNSPLWEEFFRHLERTLRGCAVHAGVSPFEAKRLKIAAQRGTFLGLPSITLRIASPSECMTHFFNQLSQAIASRAPSPEGQVQCRLTDIPHGQEVALLPSFDRAGNPQASFADLFAALKEDYLTPYHSYAKLAYPGRLATEENWRKRLPSPVASAG